MTDEPAPDRRTVAGPESPYEDPTPMWIRLDESLLTDPRYLALTVEERAGAIAVLMAGVRTLPQGVWPSADVLTQSLPRWVPESTVGSMLASGLMVDDGEAVAVADDSIYRALTPAERSAAYRSRVTASSRSRHENRHDVSLSSSSLEPPESPLPRQRVTPATPAPALRAPAHEGPDWLDISAMVEDITQRSYALTNQHSRMGEIVTAMVAKHGIERVRDAMTSAGIAAGPMPTVAQVVFGAGNMLDAIPRVRADCDTCLNMGVTARGRRPCPDCGRAEPDPRAN